MNSIFHGNDNDIVVVAAHTLNGYGVGVPAMWKGLVSGVPAYGILPHLEGRVPIPIGAMVPDGINEVISHKARKQLSRTAQLAVVSAIGARAQISVSTINPLDVAIVASTVGHDIGFLQGLIVAHVTGIQLPLRSAIASLPNMLPHVIVEALNLGHAGATTITGACSGGAMAVEDAVRRLLVGDAKVVFVTAADAVVEPVVAASFAKLGVLGNHEDPKKACRPFDRNRNGFALAEGSVTLVITTRAYARDVMKIRRPMARILGCGTAVDGTNVAIPDIRGLALMAAIEKAMAQARIDPDDIDLVIAHGSGTIPNDALEVRVLLQILGARARTIPTLSAKSLLGHSMSPSAMEALVAAMEVMRTGWLFPTPNLTDPDPDASLYHAPLTAVRIRNPMSRPKVALVLSAGLAAHYAAMIVAGERKAR